MFSDITNYYEFGGHLGIGPSMHNINDFLSSESIGRVANILNNISKNIAYPRLSEEGHVSCFFGKVTCRKIDGTYGWFVDSSYSNYGINLEYDSTSKGTFYDIYDQVTDLFSVPVFDELVYEQYVPLVNFTIETSNSSLFPFKPHMHSVDYTSGKFINFYLRNIYTGSTFSITDYTTIADKDLSIQMYGVRVVPTDIL